MSKTIRYETLFKIPIRRPVDRLAFIAECCRSKVVLDIGCFDETALLKRNTGNWLHGRIASLATRVVGIDSSLKIPNDGISTSQNSTILRGDGVNLDPVLISKEKFDMIVAGEFIEHIDNPLKFFTNLRQNFQGSELIISTPNGSSFANTLLGTIGREAQHPDHLHNFSYKILNTLCRRSELESWEIIPYRFYATEMILQSSGAKRYIVIAVESFIRLVEKVFPLLSSGYIIHAKI